ncbi:MAG: hypothetical protein IIZ40_02710 [Bacilli bacterium]|nr:hypothetical protein [Bacilli bacterium]
MDEIKDDYELIIREEYTTDKPDYIMSKLNELYPKEEGFWVLSETENVNKKCKKLYIDIFKENKKRKTF